MIQGILSIGAEFLSALPAIKAVCERAHIENLQDEDAALHLLSGIAAADQLLNLAWLLNYGAEGLFNCPSCHWRYTYQLLGDRVAIYADENAPVPSAGADRVLLDFKEHAPARCDGFIEPVADNQTFEPQITALFSLAGRARNPEPILLLRHFLGRFQCLKCGAQGPIQAV